MVVGGGSVLCKLKKRETSWVSVATVVVIGKSFTLPLLMLMICRQQSSMLVPTGSPSRDGDVADYVFDRNRPSLPTLLGFLLLLLLLL